MKSLLHILICNNKNTIQDDDECSAASGSSCLEEVHFNVCHNVLVQEAWGPSVPLYQENSLATGRLRS